MRAEADRTEVLLLTSLAPLPLGHTGSQVLFKPARNILLRKVAWRSTFRDFTEPSPSHRQVIAKSSSSHRQVLFLPLLFSPKHICNSLVLRNASETEERFNARTEIFELANLWILTTAYYPLGYLAFLFSALPRSKLTSRFQQWRVFCSSTNNGLHDHA